MLNSLHGGLEKAHILQRIERAGVETKLIWVLAHLKVMEWLRGKPRVQQNKNKYQ